MKISDMRDMMQACTISSYCQNLTTGLILKRYLVSNTTVQTMETVYKYIGFLSSFINYTHKHNPVVVMGIQVWRIKVNMADVVLVKVTSIVVLVNFGG